MSQPACATISRGSCGTLHLHVWSERFRITAEDAARLAVLGRKVPVYASRWNELGLPRPGGFAYPNGTGCAVQFAIGRRTYHVPHEVFLSLVLGKIAGVPLAEIVTDDTPAGAGDGRV